MYMKKNKIIYWVVTVLFSLMNLMAVMYYFSATEEVGAVFASIGYSAAMVYPLAFAKLLGVIAIVSRKSALLKKLAYAGFLLTYSLAIIGHLMAGDGQFGGAVMLLVILALQFTYDRKVFGTK